MLFSSIIRYGAALATLAVTANCAAIPTYDVETREITKRDMTAKDIVNAIEGVTIMSQNLQPFANQISIVNAPLFLVGLGPVPPLIQGLGQIVQTVSGAISMFGATKPFTVKSDQDSIVAAFTTFVRVHQELLNIMIGKGNILDQVPFIGGPIASVLRSIESVVDSFALSVIGLLSDNGDASKFQNQQQMLDVTLGQAIATYSG